MMKFRKLFAFLSLTLILTCFSFASIPTTVKADAVQMEDGGEYVYDELADYAEEPTTVKQNVTEEDVVNLVNNSIILVIQDMQNAGYNKEEVEYVAEQISSQYQMESKVLKAYATMMDPEEDVIGAYVNYSDVKIEKTDDDTVVNMIAILNFEKKSIKMTAGVKIFKNVGPVVTDISFSGVDKDSSLGEMFAGASVNTLLGMGTVFCVLILISLIISCFSFIPKIQAMFEKKPEKKEEPVTEDKVPVSTVVEETDDLELVAVIAAAIAASENTTTDAFVVRSIRKRR